MSRQPDYDRALERLLRISLPDEPVTATPECVHPEQLAAWSDGALTDAERTSVETHLASCGRCLAILRAFAETEPAGSVPALVTHEGSVPPRRRAPILGWRPIRWVVPISTAAAAVVIWMVLPSRAPEREAFAPTSQVARDMPLPAAPRQERFDAPSPPPPSSAARSAPDPARSRAAEPAADSERREAGTVQQFARATEKPAAEATDTLAAGQRAANESDMADRASGPVPMAPAAPPRAGDSPPPAALMRAEIPMAIEIYSPDPTRRWRLRGPIVERSTNGGSSWQTAIVPAGAIVTAGVSPAPDVCWLVGPNGNVLRTTDGSRFDAVNVPGAGTLVSVQATDANQARVTTATGQAYSTTDGGKTWN